MPGIRIAELKKKTRKVQVQYDGDTFEVEYRLHAVTDVFMSKLDAASNGDESLSRQIEQMVARWEILDESGKEIPVSPEFIRENLSRQIKLAILDAIRNDMSPDKDEVKN